MRPCLKRGARALFDFRLRFQISVFDFQSTIPALFWGLALFDLWYRSKVAILYGVTLAAIAVIGSLFAFILPLSGRSKLSVGEQIKQSVRLALMRPHIAFAVLLLDIWPIIVVLIAPQQTLMLIPLLWILVAAGASFYLQMMLVRKTFALE